MQTHFFQSFFEPNHEQNIQRPLDIVNNEQVIEISNNWEFIIEIINKYNSGNLKEVDEIEHDCLNYIISNNIDITEYKNNEEFLQKFWK